MDIVRSFLIFPFLFPSSNALRCTVNCDYKLNKTTPFFLPDSCNQTESAEKCVVHIDVRHQIEEYTIRLTSSSSDLTRTGAIFLLFQLHSNGLETLFNSTDYNCKDFDDCALTYASNQFPNIVRQPRINYRSIGAELKPLLVSNPSTENSDLVCFDSNANIRQCSIATLSGDCIVSDKLTEKNQITRSCDQEKYRSAKHVSIYDSGRYATFDIQCNRSFCNGPMTMDAVKQIFFKYNITKTIGGRLKNKAARRLEWSLMLIVVSLFQANRFLVE